MSTVPCDANVLCEITGIKTHIARLYGRTDDINDILEECCAGETTTPPPDTGCHEKVCVTTEAELRTAVAAGEKILVLGTITLTSELEINVSGTQLWGKSSPTGMAKIVRVGATGQTQSVINIITSRVELHNLDITANNPLDDLLWGAGDPINGYALIDGQRLDYGVRITSVSGATQRDVSSLVIEGCYIHNVSIGIYLSGDENAIFADLWRIVDNRIESFNYHGIYLYCCMRNLRIFNNCVVGRRKAENHPNQSPGVNETHTVPGIGIWVANWTQRCTIMGNEIAECDKCGIEIINFTYGTDTNDSCLIIGNQIHDLVTPAGKPVLFISMGITTHCSGNGVIIANNHIRNVTYYGVEIFNAAASKAARHIVTGNVISNVIGAHPDYSAWGISANSCISALITGNIINKVGMVAGSTQPSVGIMVAGGPSLQHYCEAAFDGVTVSNNQLVDAGCLCIVMGANLVGGVPDATRAGTIINNVIRFTKHRQHRPGVVGESAIFLTHPGTSVVVKNNIFYYPTDLPPNGTVAGTPRPFISGFDLYNTGTVYSGDAVHMPVIGIASDRVDIGGSNLAIPTDPLPNPPAPPPGHPACGPIN